MHSICCRLNLLWVLHLLLIISRAVVCNLTVEFAYGLTNLEISRSPNIVVIPAPAPTPAQASTTVRQSIHLSQKVGFNISSSSQSSKANLQEIADLCSALSRPDFGTSWCGLLTHEQKRSQRIRAVMKLGFSADSEIETISLASLLSNGAADLK